MNSKKKSRGTFSNIGFILAAAGSAIGLGNLWKFPYLTGENGGGIFVLIYLIIVLSIGFTCMLGEMAMGKHTKLNPVGAYKKIAKKFTFVGYLGIIVPFLIVTYYNIIGGWLLRYIAAFVMGQLNTIAGNSDVFFGDFIVSAWSPIIWTLIFILINAVIIRAGVEKGIEKASKILMPALFILIIVVVIRSVTLPGAEAGLEFYLKPDFSKLTFNTVSAALGQVFFSLSLGMGIMIAYGSYLPEDTNIEKNAMIVPALDTLIALLAGFAILPAVFAFGYEPSAGPGLIFITLPAVFNSMPLGSLWAILFFLLVLFAAITSSVSLMECPTSWLIDTYDWDRKKATYAVCVATFIVAIPESLSNGAIDFIIPGFEMNFFDFVGYIAESVLMPAAGFFMCIVIGYVWGIPAFSKVVSNNNKYTFKSKNFAKVMIKYIAPVAIFFIWLNSVGLFPIIAQWFGN